MAGNPSSKQSPHLQGFAVLVVGYVELSCHVNTLGCDELGVPRQRLFHHTDSRGQIAALVVAPDFTDTHYF